MKIYWTFCCRPSCNTQQHLIKTLFFISRRPLSLASCISDDKEVVWNWVYVTYYEGLELFRLLRMQCIGVSMDSRSALIAWYEFRQKRSAYWFPIFNLQTFWKVSLHLNILTLNPSWLFQNGFLRATFQNHVMKLAELCEQILSSESLCHRVTRKIDHSCSESSIWHSVLSL